jgi:hypothetical protein
MDLGARLQERAGYGNAQRAGAAGYHDTAISVFHGLKPFGR